MGKQSVEDLARELATAAGVDVDAPTLKRERREVAVFWSDWLAVARHVDAKFERRRKS